MLVLITGASAGIGRATARAFVARGHRVIGVARDGARLERIAEELGRDRFLPVPADVADAASMEAMAGGVLERSGVPDVVVANAGIGHDAPFAETTDEALRRVLEVNVVGVLRTVRPFLPGMVARGSGRILIVSSVVGKRGVPRYAAYAASKFALHGMADALRPELHGTGVTVGLVCPSSTVSEFQERLTREGAPAPVKRPRRHPAESVAGDILRMAGSRRREVICSAEGKAMAWVDAIAPGLMDRILAAWFARKG